MTTDAQIAAVRRFSRFYTKRLGLLDDGLLGSSLSLSEARLIYELAQVAETTASELSRALDLDPGYVSRLLRSLDRAKLIEKNRSTTDRRRVHLRLSEEGRDVYSRLNAGSRMQVGELLNELTGDARTRLVDAMAVIEQELVVDTAPPARITFRPHGPGDLGWIVERHGALYHDLRGWDERFEALVAGIVARLVERYDPARERTWIAELNGRRVGAVVLVRRSRHVGQLRLLFVEPDARGLGIGGRLVSECVSHARHVGYRRIVLFTEKSLVAARRLYEHEGFRLVEEAPADVWGKPTVEQMWELEL